VEDRPQTAHTIFGDEGCVTLLWSCSERQ